MIDFDKLLNHITQTINQILDKPQEEFSNVDGQIVEYSLSILFCALLYSQEQTEKFLMNQHKVRFDEFLLKGLFHK